MAPMALLPGVDMNSRSACNTVLTGQRERRWCVARGRGCSCGGIASGVWGLRLNKQNQIPTQQKSEGQERPLTTAVIKQLDKVSRRITLRPSAHSGQLGEPNHGTADSPESRSIPDPSALSLAPVRPQGGVAGGLRVCVCVCVCVCVRAMKAEWVKNAFFQK